MILAAERAGDAEARHGHRPAIRVQHGCVIEILGAGETVEATVRHARERQARGTAPTPDEAVVRPHGAAAGIRRLLELEERDAAARRTRAGTATHRGGLHPLSCAARSREARWGTVASVRSSRAAKSRSRWPPCS